MKHYHLEIFDPTLPHYRVRKHIGDYIQFLEDSEWGAATGETRLPVILFVCPRTTDLIYAKRRIGTRIADVWYDESERSRVDIKFAIVDNVWKEEVIGESREEPWVPKS